MKLFYGGYSTYHLDERYINKFSYNTFTSHYAFSISLNPLRPGQNCLQSGLDSRSRSVKIKTSDVDHVKKMDNANGFEVDSVELAPEHDWLSESGMSEETPLFSGSDKSTSSHRLEPKDKMRRVWLVFYMLGMTTLLPWNFFIAVNDYWNFKFRDIVNNTTHTQLQKEFTSYLGKKKQ